MALSKLDSFYKTSFLLSMEGISMVSFLLLAQKPRKAALVPLLMLIVAGVAPVYLCVPSNWLLKWGGPYSGLFVGFSDVPGYILSTIIYALQVALGLGFMAGFQMMETAQPTTSSPFLLR